MALVECTTSATPTTQSAGSGANRFGSITAVKSRNSGRLA
jgi:hypothetical protein